LDIAERSKLPFAVIHDAAEMMWQGGLLEPIATGLSNEEGSSEVAPPESHRTAHAAAGRSVSGKDRK
jgi:hypothetical protein